MAKVDPEEAQRRAEAALAALKSIEPHYFADYCSFSGQLRKYISDTLGEAFQHDRSEVRRRFHLVSILSQKYAALEDAAAMLKAFLDFRAGIITIPLERLLQYKLGEARLDSVLNTHGIQNEDDLFTKLRLMEWVPAEWPQWFGDIDLQKCLRFGCRALVSDFRESQTPQGIVAYNKIKHGLVVIPSAFRYDQTQPDCPATIYSSKQVPEIVTDQPFILHAFRMEDSNIENHERAIHFIQLVLRLLAGFYLSATYAWKVRKVWGGGTEAMFRSADFMDLLDFMRQITAKN